MITNLRCRLLENELDEAALRDSLAPMRIAPEESAKAGILRAEKRPQTRRSGLTPDLTRGQNTAPLPMQNLPVPTS